LGTSEEITVKNFKKARVSNALERTEDDYISEEKNKTNHTANFRRKRHVKRNVDFSKDGCQNSMPNYGPITCSLTVYKLNVLSFLPSWGLNDNWM
jgi:hypothetical protein